ncbi:alpha-L-rhamnosidase [Halioglobus maricola]|uniref:alpha-L-rhamnosidase n=1 Tax=Halioglobus maricola TaxID=2601894 RepID=A0A5P9NFW6_9GAMM|nr:family 78 glycoside hydrolase catalytic domain [Halioglobus maricola]QFU74426.1 alpha-L-rhamnosidase [Halioglobus maricola]
MPTLRLFFAILILCGSGSAVKAAPTHLVEERAVSITRQDSGRIIVDFGRVAFGNIKLLPPEGAKGKITVHFGEAFANGRVDRDPIGTVRYNKARVRLKGAKPILVAPAKNSRNTEVRSRKHPPAILTPAEWGVVMPFRWLEIEGWDGELLAEQIVRQSAFSSTWNDQASSFESSDEVLNQVWELSRYSIKATTFAGVYVDGDRERIPYEADAYLNQLSHYATDNDVQMARDTFDHLMQYGTWPTEWAPHMVFMAYADWMHTGDLQWLAPRYDSLRSKLLLERAGKNGLITSNKRQIERTDIVDWPRVERDDYVFTEVNTVVNAFHLRVMYQMAELADALGRKADAENFGNTAKASQQVFQETLFNSESGLYRDGISTDHSALHANLFPLAFGLVPLNRQRHIVDWLVERGMACSVYAAQYLLEGLFEYGADDAAIELMVAPGDRSWRHMVESGTTITWEAWDVKYKPNLDWNHAWGAAPANLLPRFVLGAQPLKPGWEKVRIKPMPGKLANAKGKVPTPRGPIVIDWVGGDNFNLSLTLPENVTAKVELPAGPASEGVWINGKQAKATVAGDYWLIDQEITRSAQFEVK